VTVPKQLTIGIRPASHWIVNDCNVCAEASNTSIDACGVVFVVRLSSPTTRCRTVAGHLEVENVTMLDNKVSYPPTETLCQLRCMLRCDNLAASIALKNPRRENDGAIGTLRAAGWKEEGQPIYVAASYRLQPVQHQAMMLRRFVLEMLRPRRQ